MRIILNFLMALDRVSGLLLRPALFLLLIELIMMLSSGNFLSIVLDAPCMN